MSGDPRQSDFTGKARIALDDPKLRANFRRAMDGLMAKRAGQFADPAEWASLRARTSGSSRAQ